MREHHALRKAGGAGGVNQRCNPVLDFRLYRFGFRIFVPGAYADHAHAGLLRDGCAVPLGMLGGVGRRAGGVNDEASLAMIADLVYLMRGKTGVHQHGPRVESGYGKQDGDKRPAIFANDHHAIPRTHARIAQRSIKAPMRGGRPARMSAISSSSILYFGPTAMPEAAANVNVDVFFEITYCSQRR